MHDATKQLNELAGDLKTRSIGELANRVRGRRPDQSDCIKRRRAIGCVHNSGVTPSGSGVACSVPIHVQTRTYQTPLWGDPSDPAPGIGSEIELTWTYTYGRREHDQEETYCNSNAVYIDPYIYSQPC